MTEKRSVNDIVKKDEVGAVREEMPLEAQLSLIVTRVTEAAKSVEHLSDKDVGLRLSTFDDNVRSFIFMHRKSRGNLLDGKNRERVFRAFRPTGNVLPGYQPSYAINRVKEETG